MKATEATYEIGIAAYYATKSDETNQAVRNAISAAILEADFAESQSVRLGQSGEVTRLKTIINRYRTRLNRAYENNAKLAAQIPSGRVRTISQEVIDAAARALHESRYHPSYQATPFEELPAIEKNSARSVATEILTAVLVQHATHDGFPF